MFMNIVLIGMPGCGKSTVGVLLAKSLMMDFVDTDLIIQRSCRKSLVDIIKADGIDGFKKNENDILKSLGYANTVISTGGSAVYGGEAMRNLKSGGVTGYLKLCPESLEARINNIKTRGIAMQPGCTLKELYEERAPLYEKYADITIECEGKTVEECVGLIVDAVSKMQP